MPVQCIGQSVVNRGSFDRCEDAEREASPSNKDPEHFLQGSGTIWEELQAQLAQDHVEAPIRKRYGKDIGFIPIDLRPAVLRGGSRNRQHAGVEVQAYYAPDAHSLGCKSSDDTGAASNIKHPLP
jgi:hypothetical protein